MVGISLLTLVPGIVGGSETYARALTGALAGVGELDYVVFAPTIAPDAACGLPTETATTYRASLTGPGRFAAVARATLLPEKLRRELGIGRLAALHYPLTVPVPSAKVPTAVTVHDLQHLAFPHFFSRPERLYRRYAYDRAAERAGLVIAPSEFVAGTLVERLRLPRGRVRVIHHGIDHERFRPDERARENFLLYPANRWPHKNHERLLDAFALLRRERPDLRLVLVGAGHEVNRAPEGVDVRGHVSAEELVDLYRTAAALVFPSLYEGFGSPPLEAMACGCPVAASQAGALPEVCGDAARLIDPTSAEAIAAGTDEVLSDPEPWRRKGLARAAGFSWERSARAHEAAYRELGAA